MPRPPLALAAIVLGALALRLIPLLSGHLTPPGWFDTSFHVAMALDIRDGDPAGLLHPWWHTAADQAYLVDRYRASFLYPPLINALLAAAMLLAHPGIAAILVAALLFTLAPLAAYALIAAHGGSLRARLAGAAVAAVSPALLRAQEHGFWTFPTATAFLLLSYAAAMAYGRRHEHRYLAMALAAAVLASLTHWAFILPCIAVFIGMHFHWKERTPIGIAAALALLLAPFYLVALTAASPYRITYYPAFHPDSLAAYVLGVTGLLAFRKRFPLPALAAAVTALLTAAFMAAGVRLPFIDMLQFLLPFLLAFFGGMALDIRATPAIRRGAAVLACVLLVAALAASIQQQRQVMPALTDGELEGLLRLRESVRPEMLLLPDARIGPWVTVASRGARFVHPDRISEEPPEGTGALYRVRSTGTDVILVPP